MPRKRKNDGQHKRIAHPNLRINPPQQQQQQQHEHDSDSNLGSFLTLAPSPTSAFAPPTPDVNHTLSLSQSNPPQQQQQQPPEQQVGQEHEQPPAQPRVRPRGRKRRKDYTQPIEPPFPWATNRRAKVYTLKYLLENNMRTITDNVHCKKCNKLYTIEYDVEQKFREISEFIERRQGEWHLRAPKEWDDPKPLNCQHCGQESTCKPEISKKKRNMNWLFLFLGQNLGLLGLSQLKYFCKHNEIHRTGAKNRLLLSTYLGMCKQLNPEGSLSP